MATASVVIFVGCILAEGAYLKWSDGGLGFAPVAPIGFITSRAVQMTALAFTALTIQHWVSLRWRSFSVATGFGIVAMVTGFAMPLAAGPYGGWPQYFPWSLPMLVIARQPQNIAAVLWIGGAAGLVTAAAGCIEFCRREVS
jgi:ABC-2 type transport system permease protein